MRSAVRESLLVLLAALALTVFTTWPLAARFGTAGRIDSGDGRFSVWNVAWVAHALTTDPSRLYQANILYPDSYTLAFSEPNIFAGVVAIPVWLMTHNAMATSNWVTVCAFLLSGLSSFWLVRHLTGSRSAGGLTAILFGVSPYVLSHMPHVQLLMTFGMPLSLLAMHRLVERPRPTRAVQLGLALGCQGIACGYYGIFAALAVAWGLFWFGFVNHLWRRGSYPALIVVAATVTGAIVGPFLTPFSVVAVSDFSRTLADAQLFAATWRDYLASPMLLHEWMLPYIGEWHEVLFPGFLSTAMAGFAVYRAVGTTKGATSVGTFQPGVVWFYVTLAGWALWASLGPAAGLVGLLHHLPFFVLIRATARFGVLVTLAVAVLAGIALSELVRSSQSRGRLLVGFVLALAILRSTAGPLDLFDRPAPSPASRRLAQLPMGAVAEFPFFWAAADRHRHTEYMLASTDHWKPLINGYSDYVPPVTFAEMPVLATFPSPAAWAILKRRGARYVVMHWNMYESGSSPHERIRRDFLGRTLRTIVDDNEAALFEIIAWPE